MPAISAAILAFAMTAASAPVSATQEPPKQLPGPFLIYGPVHTIRDERTTFRSVDGTLVEGPRVLVQTIEYNEDGTKQDSTTYLPDSNSTFRRVVTYAADGRGSETINFRDGKLTDRVVAKFDDHKRLEEEVTYRPDGSVANRMVVRREGGKAESESWTYDFAGNMTSNAKTSNDLPARHADSIIINRNGVVQIQSSQKNNPDGSREFRTEGSNGQFKHEVYQSGEGTQNKTIYNRDGTIKSTERRIMEFDSYHNMIKVTRLIADGNSSDFKPVDITYRTIVYYAKD